MSEEWKKIDGFDGYLISSYGRILSSERKDNNGHCVKQIIRKTFVSNSGYEAVHLSKNGKKSTKSVSRLVAIAFIDNQLFLPEVNHKDGNRLNNKVENLEWVSKSENISHSYLVLNRRVSKPWLGKFGADHHAAVALIGENKKTGEVIRFESTADAGRAGFHVSNIYQVINGKRKSHRGFSWSRECQK